jgi:hypothetical protein
MPESLAVRSDVLVLVGFFCFGFIKSPSGPGVQLKKVAETVEEKAGNSVFTQAKLMAGINKGNFELNRVQKKDDSVLSPALLQARLHAGITKGTPLLHSCCVAVTFLQHSYFGFYRIGLNNPFGSDFLYSF